MVFAYCGMYRRNGEGRARLRMRPNRWPNRKDLLIRLEIWTKSLAQQKRSSDKIRDNVGDMNKLAFPTEKIF